MRIPFNYKLLINVKLFMYRKRGIGKRTSYPGKSSSTVSRVFNLIQDMINGGSEIINGGSEIIKFLKNYELLWIIL